MTALLLAAVLALQSITISMSGHPALVPDSVASVTGQHWTDAPAIAYPGDTVLGGYTVTLAGRPCLLRYVGPDEINFLVPSDTEPGTRIATVAGPAGAFSVNVSVVQYAPILLERGGFVIATSAAAMYPMLYVNGEAIPVSPMTFNYLSVQAVGLPTQYSSDVKVILDGPQHYELDGKSYPFVGFAGVSNVTFFGPPCADGEYQIRLEVGGKVSNAGVIRFTSECAIERGVMPRARILR